MSMLTLKAFRDTLAHKGQFIALIVLVSLGITSFVTFQNGYYDLQGLARQGLRPPPIRRRDGRGRPRCRCAPREVEDVPGVAAAGVRTIQDVGLELADGRQATARIVRCPTSPGPNVNDVDREAGQLPAGRRARRGDAAPEVRPGDRIGVGDTLTLRVGGERETARDGIASDPEYMYPLRSSGDLPRRRVRRAVRHRSTSPRSFSARSAPATTSRFAGAGRRHRRLVETSKTSCGPTASSIQRARADQPGYDGLKSELSQNRSWPARCRCWSCRSARCRCSSRCRGS